MYSKQDMANNAQHVYFLQKKKAEILAKKEREKVSQEVKEEPSAPFLAPAPSPVKSEPAIQLPFANDGSFLERFKMMQQQQAEAKKQSGNQPKDTNPPIAKNERMNDGIASKYLPITEKQSLKVLPAKAQPELRAPASIFKQEDEDTYQPSEYDLATELAEQVAADGVEVEANARMKYQGDSRYRFLFDPSSPVAQFYQSKVKQNRNLKLQKKRRWDDSEGQGSSNLQASSSTITQPQLPADVTNQSSSGGKIDPLAEFAKAKALIQAKAAALTSGGVIPTPVMTEEEMKRQKAIEEQKMMNELYRKVIEQQALFASQAMRKKIDPNKPKYEYDSDEDTEGGTWEHKKRKLEMKKTQEWAGNLTDHGRGKHHLSDFLPPEELEKFMENVKAVQEGRTADISDYAKFKIQADNVGFQLLQKAGWEEGSGLGKKGDGITQPINKGKTSFDQSGVGAELPLDVKADDDDFELYRKRMMLAYKFRPNPMNNPRRPYY